MAESIDDQLIEEIKGMGFGLQLGEAICLICCLRFIDGNNIAEDFLICKNITA